MQIGQTIRKYRKELNLTQEEMAKRLGVTAPAVNKWENGNSYPDITLLPPIARLLRISPDVLLSFQENLTPEEIQNIVQKINRDFKELTFEEAFDEVKTQLEQYPNCKELIWQLAVVLDAQKIFQNLQDSEKYDAYILSCYEQVLESEDEKLRMRAADSLFGYYMRKEQYEKAESYLAYCSEQNPERKRRQAMIYSKTGKKAEAYQAYEEMLFADYQSISMIFNSIYMLALEDNNIEKARAMVEKQTQLAKLFEMGAYYEMASELDFATAQKDADAVVATMRGMLDNIEDITSFRDAKLYEHMTFNETESEFAEQMKVSLLQCFQDEETYGFLKDDERWQKIVGR